MNQASYIGIKPVGAACVGSAQDSLQGRASVLELGPFIALQVRLSPCSRCTHVDVVTHSTSIPSPILFPGEIQAAFPNPGLGRSVV